MTYKIGKYTVHSRMSVKKYLNETLGLPLRRTDNYVGPTADDYFERIADTGYLVDMNQDRYLSMQELNRRSMKNELMGFCYSYGKSWAGRVQEDQATQRWGTLGLPHGQGGSHTYRDVRGHETGHALPTPIYTPTW